MGGRWSAGAGAGRGPEHLLSLPQRPLLASEGTCSPAPGLGAPAALPPWCSLWALPRVGPRRPRAPGLGCSQVRTVTVPLAGGTVLGAQHAGSVSSCPEMAFRVGSGVRGQGAPQIQGRPHRQAPAAQPPHAAPHLQRRDGGSVNHTQPVQGGWDWGLRHRVQGGGAAHGEARARLESGRAPPPPPVGSSSSLCAAGAASARHLASGACSEAAPEALAPGHCCSFADTVAANLEGAVTFEAPDLPEETLMEVRGSWGRPGLEFVCLRAGQGGAQGSGAVTGEGAEPRPLGV